MKELFADVERWRRRGTPAVIARIVDIDGSGPRLPGAAMAVSAEGEVIGSVSGGCVEGAVVTEALQLLDDGPDARRVVTFGYSDESAFSVGLTCGGTVHLFLERLDWFGVWDAVRTATTSGQPIAVATVIDGPGCGRKLVVTPEGPRMELGSLGDPDLDRVVGRDTVGELAAGQNGVRHYGDHGEARESTITVFVEAFAPPARMLIFGAVDFTASLARAAKLLGYHVTVCDAREVFATRKRFPMADELVVDWPHRLLEREGAALGPRDAICVLTHDHKFDIPAIEAALGTNVGYLGAMGSRRTHAERMERLVDAGISAAQLGRLHAPIGLDIGARTPEETAVSVCAEIITLRTGRSGSSLAATSGPIH